MAFSKDVAFDLIVGDAAAQHASDCSDDRPWSSLRLWLEESLQMQRTYVEQQVDEMHKALVDQLFAQLSGSRPGDVKTRSATTSTSKDTKTETDCEAVAEPVSAAVFTKAEVCRGSWYLDTVKSCVARNGYQELRSFADYAALDSKDARVAAAVSSTLAAAHRRTEHQKLTSGPLFAPDPSAPLRLGTRRTRSISWQSESPKHALRLRVEKLVTGATFEACFLVAIFCNTILIAAQVQYWGFQIGYLLGLPDMERPAEDRWSGAESFFAIVEFGFGVLFSLELLVKVFALGMRFFTTTVWNWIDFLVILSWLLQSYLQQVFFNTMALRLLRMARLAKLMRLARWIQMFDSLHVLMTSISASSNVLFWATLLLVTIMCVTALVLCHVLSPYFEVIADPGTQEHHEQTEVFEYYGTFSRCILSVFEICLGNHAPAVRVLTENVSEYYGPFLLLYRLMVDFAVVKIITGVFLHETFRVANTDDGLMTAQKTRSVDAHVRKFEKLFQRAGGSNDDRLNYKEFAKCMSDPQIKTWMSAMELDVGDVRLVFELLDDGKGYLSAEELVAGTMKIKGGARSLDIMTLMYEVHHLKTLVLGIGERVDSMPGSTHTPDVLLKRATRTVDRKDKASTRPVSTAAPRESTSVSPCPSSGSCPVSDNVETLSEDFDI